jgi:hypothetical protein
MSMSRNLKAQVGAGLAVVAMAIAPDAMAYIGPGAGLGVLGALLAMLGGVVVTLFGIVLLPIRLLRRRRKTTSAEKTSDEAKTGDKKQP